MIRHIVLSIELPDDDTQVYAFALRTIDGVAVALRDSGYPSAAADLCGTSPTAYAAQFDAYEKLAEVVKASED